jgi:hypothetical protein
MIGRVYHLDRGFERIEEKLRKCAPRSSGSLPSQHKLTDWSPKTHSVP